MRHTATERQARRTIDIEHAGTSATLIKLAALPAMFQLASPALPIGAFSYSQGLEAAVNATLVTDEATALAWIRAHFLQSFLPRELHCLKSAMRLLESTPDHSTDRAAALCELNETFVASRDSAEARLETRQIGHSLLRWLESQEPDPRWQAWLQSLRSFNEPTPSAPVAFALCAFSQGLDETAALVTWGFSWLENQVQAAVKLVPLGQSSGQRILTALRPLALMQLDHSPWACTPLASVYMMRHERQYSRLFRS